MEIEKQMNELILAEKQKEDDKENSKNSNLKKSEMLEDIQHLIKEYRKTTLDKK